MTSALGQVADYPIVLIEVRNGHAPSTPAVFPAIVDTGADSTCVPLFVARGLRHVYEKGVSSPIEGAGGTTGGALHHMKIRLLGPAAMVASWGQEDIIPIEWDAMVHVCPNLKICLLGRRDFLAGFDLDLSVTDRKFSLTARGGPWSLAVRHWLASL